MGYTGEKRREYQREWQAARRVRIIALLGGKCSWCDATKSLEIDHIYPRTKDPALVNKQGFPLNWSWVRIEAELVKCWLLCKECHRIKTRDDRPELLHGTAGMWKRGCKCDECRTYSREDKRRYRAARNGV